MPPISKLNCRNYYKWCSFNYRYYNLITVPIIDYDTVIRLEGYLNISSTPARIISSINQNGNGGNRDGSVIIFSHGSGSSKNSVRNHAIASIFNRMGLSTLLIDLLTKDENEMDIMAEQIKNEIPGLKLNKFNIGLLTSRLISITRWLVESKSIKVKNVGYFGSSTGAAAAYFATSKFAKMLDRNSTNFFKIGAIVSRGGRTDLVKDSKILEQINVPSLFIVGSKDNQIRKINNKTMHEFSRTAETKIEIIDGASHLFEEEGKIEEVAEVAGRWFLKFL